MNKIYKYELEVATSQTVEMPSGAEVLCVQVQDGKPRLWAMIDPDYAMREYKTIEVYGTGHPIEPGERKYISTFQLRDGSLVFHVFEKL